MVPSNFFTPDVDARPQTQAISAVSFEILARIATRITGKRCPAFSACASLQNILVRVRGGLS